MGYFICKKAIRYKLNYVKTEEEKIAIYDKIFADYNFKNYYDLKHDMEYSYGYNDFYLDIPIKNMYGFICCDFRYSRKLTDEEVKEYLDDFKKIIHNITKDDLRFVFYCYYSVVEPFDCYEICDWSND